MASGTGSNFSQSGATHGGSSHWWLQRVTSVALVPLALWLGFSLAFLPSLELGIFQEWIRTPLNTVLLVSFLMVSAYHAALGLRVVVEDYVHSEWLKVGTIVFLDLLFFLLPVAGILAIVRIIVS